MFKEHFMPTIGTRIYTALNGRLIGRDEFGNRYYTTRRISKNMRERRWVIYVDEDEASRVPASWHGWLHHSSEFPPNEQNQDPKSWEKPHLPNMTGTTEAYLPPGHVLKGGKRSAATGDYESWRP